jgi:hypothetical protein
MRTFHPWSVVEQRQCAVYFYGALFVDCLFITIVLGESLENGH